MVRALFAAYVGPLYSVRRASDNATTNVTLLAPGGFADAAVQDRFCAGTDCVVEAIYDQSPRGNHLAIFHEGAKTDQGVNASADRHTIDGHPVYSAYFGTPGHGYRTAPGASPGVAVGEEPETLYMVRPGGARFDLAGTRPLAGRAVRLLTSPAPRRAPQPLDSFRSRGRAAGCVLVCPTPTTRPGPPGDLWAALQRRMLLRLRQRRGGGA